MGIGSIVSETLIRVKADTSDARAQLKLLRGEERRAAQERLSEMEKSNKGIDDTIKKWTTAGAVILGTVAAYKTAQAAADAYLESMRLGAASAGADIGKLAASARGLVDNDRLMASSAKMMHGVWRLNNEEMGKVARGATVIAKLFGQEVPEVMDKMAEAINTGATKSFKEFGIVAENKAGVLREIDKLYGAIGGSSARAGDEIRRSQVSLANSFGDLKTKIGELVVSLSPAISLLSKAVGLVVDMIEGLQRATGDAVVRGTGSKLIEKQAEAGRLMRELEGVESQLAAHRKSGGVSTTYNPRNQYDTGQREVSYFYEAQEQELLKQRAALKHEISRLAAEAQLAAKNWKPSTPPALPPVGKLSDKGPYELKNNFEMVGFGNGKGQFFENLSDLMEFERRQQWGFQGSATTESIADQFAKQAAYQNKAFGAHNKQAGERKSILTQIFGAPEEINATAEAISLAAAAFEGLTQAATDGFDAMITGSESFGGAFTKAIADVVRAIANQMFVESLKYGAMAVGAFFTPGLQPQAAGYAKTAGLFAAGAVAAGVVAHEMGQATGQWKRGSGSSGGGGSPGLGSGGYRPAGNGSSGETRTTIIYVGAEFASMSKIEQAGAITRLVRLGDRGSKSIRRE